MIETVVVPIFRRLLAYTHTALAPFLRNRTHLLDICETAASLEAPAQLAISQPLSASSAVWTATQGLGVRLIRFLKRQSNVTDW